MIQIWKNMKEERKKKKEERKKKKDSKADDAEALSNGENEVNQLTSNGPPSPFETPVQNDEDDFREQLKEVEQKKLLQLEMERKMELMRMRRDGLRQSQNQGQSTSNVQNQPREEKTPKNHNRITTEALKILEEVGMTHQVAQNSFYLARLIKKNDKMYDHITEYVKNGQEHEYGLKVKKIVRIVRDNDIEFRHQPDKREKLRLLLWHGTHKNAVGPILENGFQLPKPNGQMFGQGIYFADRISKSANYCDKNKLPGTKAYLFLCDVLLGNVYTAKKPHTELTEAPNGNTRSFHSVKCAGKKIPDVNDNRDYFGCLIPCGPTVKNTRFEEYSVAFNEFIVYSTENIKIMFLVEVEFTEEAYQGEEDEDDNNNLSVTRYR